MRAVLHHGCVWRLLPGCKQRLKAICRRGGPPSALQPQLAASACHQAACLYRPQLKSETISLQLRTRLFAAWCTSADHSVLLFSQQVSTQSAHDALYRSWSWQARRKMLADDTSLSTYISHGLNMMAIDEGEAIKVLFPFLSFFLSFLPTFFPILAFSPFLLHAALYCFGRAVLAPRRLNWQPGWSALGCWSGRSGNVFFGGGPAATFWVQTGEAPGTSGLSCLRQGVADVLDVRNPPSVCAYACGVEPKCDAFHYNKVRQPADSSVGNCSPVRTLQATLQGSLQVRPEAYLSRFTAGLCLRCCWNVHKTELRSELSWCQR